MNASLVYLGTTPTNAPAPTDDGSLWIIAKMAGFNQTSAKVIADVLPTLLQIAHDGKATVSEIVGILPALAGDLHQPTVAKIANVLPLILPVVEGGKYSLATVLPIVMTLYAQFAPAAG
jgi:hypothetical protein